MERVTLHPDGRLAADVPQSDPLALLGYAVELAPGCMLGSFLALLDVSPDFARLSPFLPELLSRRELRARVAGWASARPNPPLGLERLVIVKTLEMIGFPGEPRLESYVSLIGLGGEGGEEVAIKGYPVETLTQTPLGLGRLTHKVFGDAYEDMTFATTFTLFEVIETLAWQLAFHGGPLECSLRR